MSHARFHTRFEDLPRTIAVFPLAEALLLPGARLPLNIFEPRYLNMVEDALGDRRLIGMIQPAGEGDPAPLFDIGCVGRISAFAETDDGRMMITLTGVSRFRVAGEIDTVRGYRRVEAEWSDFAGDFAPAGEAGFDRAAFEAKLKRYFEATGIACDWDAIRQTPDGRLVSSLAMICPFDTREKQALLEAADLVQRTRVLEALIEIGSSGPGKHESQAH